jgi:hypothetical protein
MWASLLTPSADKCVWWLRRVKGAFETRLAKVKQESGKTPSLRAYATKFHDPVDQQEDVYMISLIFGGLHKDLAAALQPNKLAEVELMFTRGCARPVPPESTRPTTSRDGEGYGLGRGVAGTRLAQELGQGVGHPLAPEACGLQTGAVVLLPVRA